MKRKQPAQVAALNIALANLQIARSLLEQAGEAMLAGRLANLAQDADMVVRSERRAVAE